MFPCYYTALVCAEYVGNIPAEKREATIQQLNKEAQRLIEVWYKLIEVHTYTLLQYMQNFSLKINVHLEGL